MAAVTVVPVAVTIDVVEGEPVMAAARRQGLWWPTVCGGDAECGTCWVVVEDGWEHCSAMSPVERARLDLGMKAREPRARLACQLRVSGPVKVNRRSVRRAAESSKQRNGAEERADDCERRT
jgi:ferredoxin